MGAMEDQDEPKGNLSIINLVLCTAKFKRDNGVWDQPIICKGLSRCGSILSRKGLVRID